MLAKLVIVGGDDDGNGNDVEAYKAPKTVLGTSSTALETSGGCLGVRTDDRAYGRRNGRTDGRANGHTYGRTVGRSQTKRSSWRQLGNGSRTIEVAGFAVEEISCSLGNIPIKAYTRKFGMCVEHCLRMQVPRNFRTSTHSLQYLPFRLYSLKYVCVCWRNAFLVISSNS